MGPYEPPENSAEEAPEAETTGTPTMSRLGETFESLPFPARSAALAQYARALSADAYHELHIQLDTGDLEDRRRGLFMAVARRDLSEIARALRDPLLRRAALSASLRLPVPDSALADLVTDPAPAVRHDTFRVLRLGRRHRLAAELLPEVHRAYGNADATLLLPACPESMAWDWLPRLVPPAQALGTLARTAPRAVAAHIAARHAGTAQAGRHTFRRAFWTVAGTAARRDPSAALILLEHAPDLLGPAEVRCALLRPADALRILRAAGPPPDSPRLSIPAAPLPPSLRRALAGLGDEGVEELTRYVGTTERGRRVPNRQTAADPLLMALPPERRRRAALARLPQGNTSGTPSPAALAVLPPEDRSTVAASWPENWFENPRRAVRLALALPLAQAEPVLRRLTDAHRVHLRWLAWPALLACAELSGDPTQYARVVRDCERAWHDRELVRQVFLVQLANAAPRFLAALPHDVLRDVTLTAVQARDTNAASLKKVEDLLRRVHSLRVAEGDAAAATAVVALLAEVVSDPRRPGQVAPLALPSRAAPPLRDAVESSLPGRPDLCVAVAELFAPQLTALPALDARVREIALGDSDVTLAARAAAAWAGPAGTREERCAELLSHDITFACVPVVLRTVATRRTDLMGRVIDGAAARAVGRLRPRATPWTLSVPPGAPGRWLPAQRRRWDALHARVAADESLPVRVRSDAVRALQDPGELTTFLDNAPVPVITAALAGLGARAKSVPPETARDTVGALLRHAGSGGTPARAAMTALRRLLARLPAEDAIGLLGPLACADDTPVGSRKEAARALGGIAERSASAALIAAWDAPGQHRDVRAVIAQALLPEVDRPAVAERLASHADDLAVREAILRGAGAPWPGPREAARVSFLMSLLPAHGDDTCLAVVHVLGDSADGDSGRAALALAEVAKGERPRKVWEAAIQRLNRLQGRTTPAAMTWLCEELAARAAGTTGEPRFDALRRLHACVPRQWWTAGQPSSVRAADRVVPLLRRSGLHADAAHLAWLAALDDVRRGRCDPGSWDALLELLDGRSDRLPGDPQRPDAVPAGSERARSALLEAARLLRARGTAQAGALAVMLVGIGGAATSWSTAWRAELDALRAHQDQDTATAALLLTTGTG